MVFWMSLVDKLHFKNMLKDKKNILCAHRKQLHHPPDALCQQVRALIDLRLPNCTLIKEWSCLVPSFLLILILFIWFWGGHSWAQCEGLARSCEFIFLPMCPFRSVARSERWLHSRESEAIACRTDSHVNRQEEGHTTEWVGKRQINWGELWQSDN